MIQGQQRISSLVPNSGGGPGRDFHGALAAAGGGLRRAIISWRAGIVILHVGQSVSRSVMETSETPKKRLQGAKKQGGKINCNVNPGSIYQNRILKLEDVPPIQRPQPQTIRIENPKPQGP